MNDNEKRTVSRMIHLYCQANHQAGPSLCDKCAELHEYALKRLERCVFGNDKPTCEKCPVHCYKPEMRLRIKDAMRFAGPRMIYHNPAMAVRHLLKNLKPTPNLKKSEKQ